jgi:hypothetical protein
MSDSITVVRSTCLLFVAWVMAVPAAAFEVRPLLYSGQPIPGADGLRVGEFALSAGISNSGEVLARAIFLEADQTTRSLGLLRASRDRGIEPLTRLTGYDFTHLGRDFLPLAFMASSGRPLGNTPFPPNVSWPFLSGAPGGSLQPIWSAELPLPGHGPLGPSPVRLLSPIGADGAFHGFFGTDSSFIATIHRDASGNLTRTMTALPVRDFLYDGPVHDSPRQRQRRCLLIRPANRADQRPLDDWRCVE